ncbi:DUF924 family protein [Aspergillus stella-maris]|uniref:DUF924 family protein n=1 Tax=Aspergillus stella-maris TaxID=1810926 RepID=UPI003CCD59D3
MLLIARLNLFYRRLLTLRPHTALRTPAAPSPHSLPHTPSLKTPIALPIARTRAIHTGPKVQQPKMSNESKVDLAKFLDASVPGGVYNLWFQHVAKDQDLTLPTFEVAKPWFTKDAAFDLECSTQFKPILAAIHQSRPELKTEEEVQAQAKQILDLVKPVSALDWLGLIILLDQLPRNCYRGPESALVFTYFDPISRVIASQALKQNADHDLDVRYHLALRLWFYLPFMHSEDLSHQELVLAKHGEMEQDVRNLCDKQPTSGFGDKEQRAREVFANNRKALDAYLKQNAKFQKEHHDIIAQFGRYPYRNVTLGRETTPEEEKWLKETDITFGSG